MKAIIAGSRNYNNYVYLKQQVDYFREHQFDAKITEIVSGGARGVDSMGERYAAENDISLKIFPADWNKHGKAAGHIRNRQMADYADILIAVWDGESKGTKNMIDTMQKLKKPVFVVWIGAPTFAQGSENETTI